MATDKKKKKASSKKKKGKDNSSFLKRNLWKICILIALFDLAHALYFVIQATITLVTSFNIYSILALLGTIFWVLIVILFVVGLWKRRPIFVKAWIIFSIAGFIADILLLLWGIATSISVDWDHLNEFSIIFMGIFIEFTCIYLVYKYYLCMDPCRLVDEPEKGRQRKKRKIQLDARACRADRQKAKKSEKKKKSPKKK